MKKILFIALLAGLFYPSLAHRKTGETLVGFGFGVQTYRQAQGLPPLRLGIRSFSYNAGLEHRFAIHRRLHFSLQYTLSTLRMQQHKLNETLSQQARNRELQAGLSLQAVFRLRPGSCVLTGFSVQKPLFSCVPQGVQMPSEWSVSQRPFSAQDIRTWNPCITIGFEKQFNLFNRDWRCNLQYQLGIVPKDGEKPVQGLSMGLRYVL